MIRYNKGGGLIWFDGGVNGQITRPAFIGYGDGTTTAFNLPFRWIYPESMLVSVNHATVTAWTVVGRIIMFTSAPAADSIIQLDEAKMRFKAFFAVDSDILYTMTDNFKSYMSAEIKITEWPN
jgi:hypothetical protein